MNKKVLRGLYSVFALILSLIIAAHVTYAESHHEFASKEIQAEVEADYNLHFRGATEAAKQDFGVKDGDSDPIQLGDGIPYYRISAEGDEPSFNLSGYAFPLKHNGKPVGTVYAINDAGLWRVLEVSSISDMEQAMSKAEAALNQNDETKLIDDDLFDVYALYIKGPEGERIQRLDSKRRPNSEIKSMPFTDFKNKIHEMKIQIDERIAARQKEKGGIQMFGSAAGHSFLEPDKSTSGSSYKTAIVLFSLGVIFLLPVLYMLGRKKRS